jgi:hypothetical protein
VPEQVLNGADVGAALTRVGAGGMTNGMGADVLRQTGATNRHLAGLVNDARVNMMAPDETSRRVNGESQGRNNRRPAPCLGGMRVFPSQRTGQVDLAMLLSQVLLMPCLDAGQVIPEQRGERAGKVVNRSFALARTDGQWLHLNIDVLDHKLDRFHDAQAAPVEKFGHQLGGAMHEREDGGDFFACHDHGGVESLVGTHGIDAAFHGVVEDALVEEY